jgi:hypothetical protein
MKELKSEPFQSQVLGGADDPTYDTTLRDGTHEGIRFGR